MAKLSLTNLVSLTNVTSAIATINANYAAIVAALEKCLFRDGTSPNTMEANLDMNNKRILNLPVPSQSSDPVRLADLNFNVLPANTVPAPNIINASTILQLNASGTAYQASPIVINSFGHIIPISTSVLGSPSSAWGGLYVKTATPISFENYAEFRHSLANNKVTLTGAGLSLDNLSSNGGYLEFQHITSPANPPVGYSRIFIKGTGDIYTRSSAGTEVRATYPVATQADMEAAVSAVNIVTPSIQHQHPGHPKAWAKINGGATPSIVTGYNVASVSRAATGRLTVTFTNAMSNAHYCISAIVMRNNTTLAAGSVLHVSVRNAAQTTTSFELDCVDNTATTSLAVDPAAWYIVVHGDM